MTTAQSAGSGLFSLQGRVAAVTGASQGIGAAIAAALAVAGADVVGTARGSQAPSELVDAVQAAGRTLTWLPCDMADPDAVAALADQLGSVDVLVNNAGMIIREPAVGHSDQTWHQVMQVNLNAPFVLAREVGSRMVERGSGKIIFIASMLSFQGGIRVPSYTASKSAIAGLTKALACEWAASNVNVNAIAPGYIATANTQALRDDPVRSRDILARIPAGRWGEADDIGATAVFLASEAARYVHGAVIPVDGGWLAR
ncbi:SDR family oxidoreductase [Propionibacteriaceae bacterium G1746]|uniref:SDR family oxidoreductase n=1 Tax=Aestuariimicrobium sp. G57 TaxID=3418485 RepID=UPI003C215316